MDDFENRSKLTYLGLTCAFWLMPFAMIGNRANYASNPAWQTIEWLKAFFTWGGVIALAGWGLLLLLEHLNDIKRKKREEETRRQDALLQAEQYRIRQEEQSRIDSEKRIKEEKEKLENDKIRAKEMHQLRLERERRSVEEATSKALSGF